MFTCKLGIYKRKWNGEHDNWKQSSKPLVLFLKFTRFYCNALNFNLWWRLKFLKFISVYYYKNDNPSDWIQIYFISAGYLTFEIIETLQIFNKKSAACWVFSQRFSYEHFLYIYKKPRKIVEVIVKCRIPKRNCNFHQNLRSASRKNGIIEFIETKMN